MSIAARLDALARRLPCPDPEHTRPIEHIDVRAGEPVPPATPRPTHCPTCGRALRRITQIIVEYPAGFELP